MEKATDILARTVVLLLIGTVVLSMLFMVRSVWIGQPGLARGTFRITLAALVALGFFAVQLSNRKRLAALEAALRKA